MKRWSGSRAEELGVACPNGRRDRATVTFHRYPSKSVLLLFYEARLVSGSPEPQAVDVAAVGKWAGVSDLCDDLFPPADLAVLAKVRTRLAVPAT